MFDVRRFIADKFATPKALYECLDRWGFEPPALDSVQKWSTRGSIPGVYLAAALFIIEQIEGTAVEVSAYIIRGSECKGVDSMSKNLASTGEPCGVFE